MTQWMEYVYAPMPEPTNATGVPVTINVIDSNGNYRQIGTTTGDSSSMFTFAWTPNITGSYPVLLLLSLVQTRTIHLQLKYLSLLPRHQ